MDTQDIQNRFVFHPATPEQGEKYAQMRQKFLELAEYINETCPDSREKSVAITQLEQAQFWANASIARNS